MPAAAPQTVVHVKSLSKSFGKVHALSSVDLEIGRGEFFGFFGPNGAGKTTLLRILTGQLEPSEGSASVMGIDLPEGAVEVRANVGVVPEFESPPSFLTGDIRPGRVTKLRGPFEKSGQAEVRPFSY